MTLKDERRRYLAIQKFSSESDTIYSRYENEERGCARAVGRALRRGHLNEVKMTERKTTACFSSGNRKGFLCRIYEAENRLPMQ